MTHAQEAWNDEQGMLRYSCIGPDEQAVFAGARTFEAMLDVCPRLVDI